MIAFFRHAEGGCYYYRILQKMEALNRAGIKTQMIEVDADVTNFDEIKVIQLYGIYPFGFEKVLTKLKEAGKKIVYDNDDAMELIDESNHHYWDVKKDTRSFHEIVPFVDEFTVSTTQMSTYIKNYAPRGKITVIPNTYNPTEWTFPRPKREGIRIGFVASASHIADLPLILPAIRNLQKKYDIKFLLMGFGEGNYQEILNAYAPLVPKGKEIVKEIDSYLKEIKFEWIPFVSFPQFFPTLTNLALDFGLCPLHDTKFNHHRSPVKAMEYTLSGALALASNLPPYWEDQSSVLTNPDQWESKLEYCIQNPKEVATTKSIHRNWIEQNRNVHDQIDLLKSVYVG